MKNKQKGSVVPVLVGIIVILIIGGLYFYSKSQTQTVPSADTVATSTVDKTLPTASFKGVNQTSTPNPSPTPITNPSPKTGIISTPAKCSNGATNPPHCNADGYTPPSQNALVITAFSSPSNIDNSFYPGETVSIKGKNLGGCDTTRNCETPVYIGKTEIYPNAPTTNTLVTFTVPQIPAGTYEMYIQNHARGEESNNVQVTILSR